MKARFFAIAALVLGLASCQKDFAPEANLGGEVDYRIAVSAPELGTTRAGVDGEADTNYAKDSAFGAIDYFQGADWSKVDLRYTLEIYDADENGELKGGVATLVKDRQAIVVDEYKAVTFETRLAPKRNYRFVVFADFVEDGAATAWSEADKLTKDGLRHSFEKSLTNITLIKEDINDEASDAYFAVKHVVPSNNTHNTDAITLTRPYGKLRVVATDLHELNLNVKPGSVKVVYGAYNAKAFNAVTGEIAEEYAEKEFDYNYVDEGIVYTEGYDALKGEKDRNTHMTIFTDYILATDTQHTINFNMLVNDEDGVEIKATAFSTEIPVQRNHLTTIIGNVLTTATEIEVTINDNFDGYYNREVIFVANAEQLQKALDNLVDGQLILFDADIKGDVTILQKEGVNVVISGCGYKFDGTITINGDARAKGAETVLLEGINFYTNEAKTFIDAPTKINSRYNYSHNITVDGCTFEAETYNEGVVGIKLLTTYNAVVKNSSAKNIHSFAQFQSTDNETVIENVKVENCKNGISLGNMAKATIKDAEISAKGYGIRLDGEKTRTVAATIENATINAYIPVNIRKMNDDACNVDVEFVGENNALTGFDYEIAFCSNEYEEGVAPQSPKGTFRLQNAEEARAYYGDVTSFSAFDAAINSTNNPEVKVESDITMVGLGVEVERDVTIDFDGKEFNAGSDANSYWYALEIKGDHDVKIENAYFTRAGIFAGENANVVFESGTINHKPERTSRYIFCARSGATITVKDGTFTNDRAKNSFFWADAATIIVEGGTYTSVYGVKSNNKIVTTNGGQVIIKAGTFEFDPSKWTVSTSVVEKVGSNWVVTPITPSTNISDAITNVENGGKVVLADGNYTMPAINNKAVTIVGSRDVVLTVNKPNMTGADVTLEGITVKGSGYATGVQHVNTVTYNNVKVEGEMCLYGEAVTFNNCEFELANGKYIWTYGCKNSTFNNCVFNTAGKAILVYNEGAGATNVTVKGCTFNASAGAKAGAIANQNCAAIEIDNFQSSNVGVAHNVTASNNTVGENFSGEWRIKNFLAGDAITVNGTAYTQIAIDGQLMTIDADKNVTVL